MDICMAFSGNTGCGHQPSPDCTRTTDPQMVLSSTMDHRGPSRRSSSEPFLILGLCHCQGQSDLEGRQCVWRLSLHLHKHQSVAHHPANCSGQWHVPLSPAFECAILPLSEKHTSILSSIFMPFCHTFFLHSVTLLAWAASTISRRLHLHLCLR